MSRTSVPVPDRRDVLRGGAAAVIGAAVGSSALAQALPRPRRFRTGDDGQLRVGLIGCGGRGTGAAANALRADPYVRLVALADTFEDHLQNCLRNLSNTGDVAERVDVAPEMQFVGFEGYKGVVDNCDVVLLATSPHFRPLHVEYAVEQGKHLFVEKPVATDAPGTRRIHAACEAAKEKRLSIVSGLCYRYEQKKRDTIARIRDGAVGDVVALRTSYNTGGLWHRGRRPEWSDMEWQVRNWLYFSWLSGDHIAEQHIHSLDKIAWVMGDEYPAKCTASGGRIVRTDPKYGDVFDHFNCEYEYASGPSLFASCRQWPGASGNVSDQVYGTKGTAHIQTHRIEGEERWRWRKPSDDFADDMYQNEHDALFAAIRDDEPINDGDYMCRSTLMAIMGRMSAYTGKTVTWDQVWNSALDLAPPAYDWTDLDVRDVAQPGITPFV